MLWVLSTFGRVRVRRHQWHFYWTNLFFSSFAICTIRNTQIHLWRTCDGHNIVWTMIARLVLMRAHTFWFGIVWSWNWNAAINSLRVSQLCSTNLRSRTARAVMFATIEWRRTIHRGHILFIFNFWIWPPSMLLAHLIRPGEKCGPISLIYLYLMAIIIIALHKFKFRSMHSWPHYALGAKTK